MAIREVTLDKPVVLTLDTAQLVAVQITPTEKGWQATAEWLLPNADGTTRKASVLVAPNAQDVALIDAMLDSLVPPQ